MPGRIRRLLNARAAEAADAASAVAEAEPICPLCERPIPASQRDAHHLVPRSRGGRATEYLHRICHRQIHALLTESELEQGYSTVEALLAHPELRRFVDWVRTKPDDFMARTRKSDRLRRR